jgi:PTH1 family peptidyl-tRNA hydrolase
MIKTSHKKAKLNSHGQGAGYICQTLTFMNDSGLAIRKIMDYYDLLPERIDASTDISDSLIVIHDELDVKLGEYKVATSSNSAGHNGIKSIIEHLSTKNFRLPCRLLPG